MQEKSARHKTLMGSGALRCGAICAAAFLLIAPSFAYAVEIKNAWSRETPPGAQVGAGFAILANPSSTPDRLLEATADVSEHVEIHEMSMADGVMKMRQIPGLDIPANQNVELRPGANHLMFIGLKHPLKEGEHFKGVLKFEKAGSIPVEFIVKKNDSAHSAM